MRVIITITIILMGSINTFFAQEKYTVTINFDGMESDKGKLFVAVYNNEKDFLKKILKGTVVEVKDQKAMVVLKDISAGTYAISAFHDENENKKLDTNFLGIPKEPIGVSNNATGFMGPPKYKNAKFKVNKDLTMSINVN